MLTNDPDISFLWNFVNRGGFFFLLLLRSSGTLQVFKIVK